MFIEDKLESLNIILPKPPAPGGNYVPYRRTGNLVYLAGTISFGEDKHITGQLGQDLSLEEGQEAARLCCLNVLATLKEAAGSLDKIRQIVFMSGYVNAVSGYPDSPLVINGASNMLIEVFGDAGRHARAAVAVAGLPKNAAVELQVVAELS